MRAEEERERQKRQRQKEHAKRRSLQGLQNDTWKRTKDFEKRVSCWEKRVVRLVCRPLMYTVRASGCLMVLHVG